MRISTLNESNFEDMRVDKDAVIYNMDQIKELIKNDELDTASFETIINAIESISEKVNADHADDDTSNINTPTEPIPADKSAMAISDELATIPDGEMTESIIKETITKILNR